jgi:hypothetical protein
MNVIVLLAATAITTTFLSFAPMTAAQGKQVYACAGSGEDVSARRRKPQYYPRYYHQEREILPKLAVLSYFREILFAVPVRSLLFPFSW